MEIDLTKVFGTVFSEYGLLVTGLSSMVVYLLRDKSKRDDRNMETIEKVVSALNNNTNALDKLTDRMDRHG